MRRLMMSVAAVYPGTFALRMPLSASAPQAAVTPKAGVAPKAAAGAQPTDLAGQLAAGKLRGVNRDVTPLKGDRAGIRVAEKAGPGVVWIEGSNFTQGTIELEVRGRMRTAASRP